MYYPVIDRETLWQNIPQYCAISLFFTIIGIFMYIKIKYPFWNIQPVYHTYDFLRGFISSPFIIQTKNPMKTKYCDFISVETVSYVEVDERHKKMFVDLLQCHYIPAENTLFMFHLDNLEKYMIGHIFPSYLSFYKEPKYNNYKDVSGNIIIQTKESAIGCISSRSAELVLFGKKEPIYYIDFVCVHRDYQDKHISRYLLQTHEFRQRSENMLENVFVSLIKKEVDLYTGIVPLIQYETFLFEIGEFDIPPLPAHFILTEINSTSINTMVDFLELSKSRFSIFGITDIGNLTELVKSGVLYVYCMKRMNEIYSMYFFRDSRIQCENEDTESCAAILQLCGTIQNSSSFELFYTGFLYSVNLILKQVPLFKMILFENLGHTSMIVEYWDKNRRRIAKTNVAYYLYNMVVPKSPIDPMQCFIMI